MQIGMARVSVANERFVMTAARAQWARPATVAIVFGVDMSATQKISLLFTINTGRDVAERVLIGIDKPMARRNITPR